MSESPELPNSPPGRNAFMVGEDWYGNAPPQWERADNNAHAWLARLALIKRLRRHPFCTDIPSGLSLVEKLVACEGSNRCGSGACPECARAAQRWLTSFIVGLSAEANQRGNGISPLYQITVIPPNVSANLGKLRKMPLMNAKRDLIEALEPHVACSVGAFDFSWNDNSGKGGSQFWQPHFHLIAAVSELASLKAALSERYKPFEFTPRPVHFEDFDGSALGASYTMRWQLERRSSYIVDDHPTRKPFSQSWSFNLRARPHIDISLLLDRMGFNRRLVWVNLKPVRLEFVKRLE